MRVCPGSGRCSTSATDTPHVSDDDGRVAQPDGSATRTERAPEEPRCCRRHRTADVTLARHAAATVATLLRRRLSAIAATSADVNADDEDPASVTSRGCGGGDSGGS
jgi:hypothetical protein